MQKKNNKKMAAHGIEKVTSTLISISLITIISAHKRGAPAQVKLNFCRIEIKSKAMARGCTVWVVRVRERERERERN